MKGQTPQIASSGVEELIEKLREKGVLAGQEKARDIVANAQKRAEWIVEEAELEAKQLLAKAKAESEALQTAGQDALKLAARDALLRLRDTLLGSFSEEITRVVGKQLVDEEFMQRLILALACRVREESGLDNEKEIVFRLPADAVGINDLKKNPEELKQGSLTHFAASIAANLLRQGVTFEVSDDIDNGLTVKLEDHNMTIDFTDQAVAALLLDHLQPRFRALLQGIVK